MRNVNINPVVGSAPGAGYAAAPPITNRFWGHHVLILVAVVGAMLETALLGILGRPEAKAFGVQVTATAPFGVFHDLRWLLVYHYSWLSFGWELAALVVFRTLLNAVLVHSAWPQGYPMPSFGMVLKRSLRYTVVALIVLYAWAALLFAAAVSSLSWFWYAGLVPALVIALFIHPWAISGDWMRLPSWSSTGWTLLSFLVLTAGGVGIVEAPLWGSVVSAGIVGVFNAWAWFHLVRAVVWRDERPGGTPLTAFAVIVVYGLVIWGAHEVFSSVHEPEFHTGKQNPAEAALPGAQPMLVANGLDSTWSGNSVNSVEGPYHEVAFSYRGLDANEKPLPYSAVDTHLPLNVLAQRMDAQVRALYHRTGKPVIIVAESEGTLVSQMYLNSTPDAPVKQVILMSPLMRLGRVYYPVELQNTWGVAGGWGVHQITRLITLVSDWKAKPDMPILRYIIVHAPAMRELDTCPMGRVAESELIPVAASVVTPVRFHDEIPHYIVPAMHGGILKKHAVNEPLQALLKGKRPAPAGAWWWVFRAGQSFGVCWRSPDLGLGQPAAWQAQFGAQGSGGAIPCPLARKLLMGERL